MGLDQAERSHPDQGLGVLAAQAVEAANASRPELRGPVLGLAAYHEWNQGHMERARALIEDARRDAADRDLD